MRTGFLKIFGLWFCIWAGLLAGALPVIAAPNVLTSIKPVHAIASIVMAGTGTPHLLLNGSASPHSYALKPSDARALKDADIVFWIGPDMENFLDRPLSTLGARAISVQLEAAKGVTRLPAREGGLWGHDDHDRDHGAHTQDGHIWLDPMNGVAMARAMADTLIRAHPHQAARYRANLTGFTKSMEALDRDIARRLAPVRSRPFLVFHDAYHYFEARYRLNGVGAVSVAPDRPVGARRMSELRDAIAHAGALCIGAPPQFPPKLLNVLAEGTRARIVPLDEMGAVIAPGPKLYETLLRGLSNGFAACLGPAQR